MKLTWNQFVGVVVLGLVMYNVPAFALSYTWAGPATGNVGTSWTSPTNWSPNGTPVAGDSITIPDTVGATPVANLTITLDANQACLNIIFNSTSGTVTLGTTANTLAIGTGGVITANQSAAIICNITPAGAFTSTTAANATLTLSGNVGGGTNLTMTCNGTGTVLCNGTVDNVSLGINAISGTLIMAKASSGNPNIHAIGGAGLTINGATVRCGGTGGDQVYDGCTVTMNSGVLDLNGTNELILNLNAPGGTILNNGTTPSILTLSGTSTIAAAVLDHTTGASTLGITVTGTATLSNSAGASNFSGGAIVNGAATNATLNVTNNGANLGTGPVTVSGGAATTGTLNINGLIVPNAVTMNSGSVTTGSGTYGGNFTINGGNLQGQNYAGKMTFATGTTTNINAQSLNQAATFSGLIAGSGNINVGGASNGGQPVSFTNIVTPSTYNGTVTIGANGLVEESAVAGINALGTAAIIMPAATGAANNAFPILRLRSDVAYTYPHSVTFTGPANNSASIEVFFLGAGAGAALGVANFSSSGQTLVVNGANTYSLALPNAAFTTSTIINAMVDVSFAGPIGIAGSITGIGTGVLRLNNNTITVSPSGAGTTAIIGTTSPMSVTGTITITVVGYSPLHPTPIFVPNQAAPTQIQITVTGNFVLNWVGGNGTDLATAANWNPATSPADASGPFELVFGGANAGTLTNSMPANTAVHDIVFNGTANGYILTGNGITLQSNGTTSGNGIDNQTGSNAVNLPIALSINSTTFLAANATTLSIGGAVSGGLNVTQSGAGTLILAGNNSYANTTVGSGGTLQVGTGGATGSLGSGSVNNNGVLNFNLSGSTTISGPITGSGSLVKNGSGTVILTAASGSSFGGNVTVNAGTLQAGNNSTIQFVDALGAGTAGRTVTINQNAVLEFQGRDITSTNNIAFVINGGTFKCNGFNRIGALTLNGGTISTGIGTSAAAQALSLLGPVTVSGTAPSFIVGLSGANTGIHLEANPMIFDVPTTGAAVDLTITAGLVNGSGGLAAAGITKSGAGKLGLSGGNTYTGPTAINAGTVVVLPGTPLGLSPQLWFDAAAPTVLRNGTSVTQWQDRSGFNRHVSQAVATAQPTYNPSNPLFNKLPTIAFTTVGGNKNLTGFDSTFLNNSSYTIFVVEAKASTAQNYFIGTNHSATNQGLHFGYRNDTSFTLAQYNVDLDSPGAPAYTGTQVPRVWSGKLDTAAGHFIYLNGVLRTSNAVVGNFAGLVAGDGIVGAGYSLSGQYTGDLAEIIVFNSALNDTQRLAVDTYLQNKWGIATLPANGNNFVLSPGSAHTIAAGATLDLNNSRQNVGSLSGSTGTILLGSGTLNAGADNTDTSYGGTMTGAGNFGKFGTGTMTLAAALGYTGNTTVGAGTLKLGVANAIPFVPSAGDVTVNGTLDLNAFPTTLNAVNGFGTIDSLAGGTLTLTLGGNNHDGVYYGTIRNSAGSISVVKTGTGTQSLGGVNTYSGTTTISSGTVRLLTPFPSGVAPAIWYDASDAASLVLNANSVVQWKDKSGNGSDVFQGVVASAPLRTASNPKFKNLTTLTFNTAGGNKYMRGFDATFLNGSSYTIFAVEGKTTTAQAYFLGTSHNTTNQGLHFGYRADADFTIAQFGNDLDWTAAPVYGGNQVAREWTGRLDTTAGHTLYMNGTQQASNGNTAAFTNQNLTDGIVGAGYVLTAPYNGDLGEILIFNSALSDPQRQLVDAYLQGKWGISGSGLAGPVLPSTTAVTISNTGMLDLNGVSQNIASLSSNFSGAQVLLGSGSLSVGDNTDTNFSGVIGGSGSLTKTGSGTWIVGGNVAHFGNTSINSGTVDLAGLMPNTSAVNVSSGAVLRGRGVIGAGTVNVSGTLFPGQASSTSPTGSKGNLTVANLMINANGVLKLRVSGSTGANVESDKLIVTGTSVVLAPAAGAAPGATLELRNAVKNGSYNASLTLIEMQNGTPLTTTFPNISVPNQTAEPNHNQGLSVTYSGGFGQIIPLNGQYTGGGGPIPAVNVVALNLGANVTPVTVVSFDARAEGAGVQLEWGLASEFQNAGFNIFRRGIQGWVRVNPTLISGRITSADFKSYQLYDWTEPGIYEYRLESVGISGEREIYSKTAGRVTLDLSEPRAVSTTPTNLDAAQASLAAAAEYRRGEALSGKFAATRAEGLAASTGLAEYSQTHAALAFNTQGKLVLPASVRRIAQNDGAAAARGQNASGMNFEAGARWFTSAPSRTASFTAAKIVYDEPGVLLISQSALPAGFDIRRVSVQREGRGMNALAMGANGLVLFAPGYADDYTNKDALFLRKSGTPTAAGSAQHAQGLFNSSLPVNVSSSASVSVDYHDVYFDYDLRPYSYAPWFSSQYLTDGTTRNFAIDTPDAGGGTASLTVNVWSLTADHALQVLVNGVPVGQAQWSSAGAMMQLTFQIGAGVLRSSGNEVEFVTPVLPGVAGQIALVHSMSIGYTRALDGSKPIDVYASGASRLYEVSNVPSADAWVVDARFQDRAALVAYETQAQANGSFTLRFVAAGGGTGRYLVVPAGMENTPVSVSKRAVKPAPVSAYLAAGPGQFAAGVQPLLALRSKEGLRTAFVDQEQLFDYYNYGRYGPAGIQNAVRATHPQYLLLVGRTTYDYRNYSGLNVDPLCPAFLVSTTFWAQATSDSLFGDLGRGIPQVAVGRLPVNTAGELRGAVNRIMSCAGASTGGRVHAIADRFDAEAGDFAAQAESIAQAHPELAWQRNYLGLTYQGAPEVAAAMRDAANGGADILVYLGHGNAVRLGKDEPRILQTDQDHDTVKDWTGNVVFLQATCTANWMARNETGYRSIAIQALTQPQGGISASIASSTYMNSNAAAEFMSELLLHANAGGKRWGDALLKTQQWASVKGGTSTYYDDLRKTEQLFGDPAMPIFSKAHKPAPSTGSVPGAF